MLASTCALQWTPPMARRFPKPERSSEYKEWGKNWRILDFFNEFFSEFSFLFLFKLTASIGFPDLRPSVLRSIRHDRPSTSVTRQRWPVTPPSSMLTSRGASSNDEKSKAEASYPGRPRCMETSCGYPTSSGATEPSTCAKAELEALLPGRKAFWKSEVRTYFITSKPGFVHTCL